MRPHLAIILLAACASSSPAEKALPAAPADAPADHHLRTTTTHEAGGTRTRIAGRDVDLVELPTRDLIGLPLRGRADVAIDLLVPDDGDLRRASGSLAVTCPGRCTLGDDATRLQDMSFGHLDFDHVEVRATLAEGKAELTQWSLTSPDVDLAVTLHADLGRDLASSTLAGCLRFRPTAALRQRDGRMAAMLDITGGAVAADGMTNIRLEGAVTAPARLARICDGTATAAATPTTTEPTATTPAMTTSASNDVDPATAAAITAGVTTHAGRVEVAASLLARVTAEPMAFARGVRIVPAFRDGQAEGFKLYAIRPGSLAAALGLANGDTLLRLAGHSLVERDGDTAAWIALRDARAGDTITLELVRRAAPVTLSYHLR